MFGMYKLGRSEVEHFLNQHLVPPPPPARLCYEVLTLLLFTWTRRPTLLLQLCTNARRFRHPPRGRTGGNPALLLLRRFHSRSFHRTRHRICRYRSQCPPADRQHRARVRSYHGGRGYHARPSFWRARAFLPNQPVQVGGRGHSGGLQGWKGDTLRYWEERVHVQVQVLQGSRDSSLTVH